MTSGHARGTQEEQEKYFSDACDNVRKNAFFMQQQLDAENLQDALRYAATMINELRTSKLYPSRYYEVYMNVTTQLAHLEAYIESEYKKKAASDVTAANVWLKFQYDRVQWAANIVPRLYLLATIASVCLKIHVDEHEEVMRILFDLVSMTKGVQHPTRGLFLRNYLSQISRSILPDVPETVNVQSLDDHPIVKRAVDFVLQNFAEMTRLWVRMQHQGAVRDRSKRERERLQLRMLVGTNLRRLSELNVVSGAIYQHYVLKKVTEQIVKCKDRIAQEYLMECLIMVFSDDYHLRTLEAFLSVVSKLQSTVNINSIVIKLMERLAKYAAESENALKFAEKNIFAVFQTYCGQIVEKHKKMTFADRLALNVELVHFAAQCYAGKDEYIGQMLEETLAVVQQQQKAAMNAACVSHLHRMLVAPIRAMNVRVLQFPAYCALMSTLPSREDVARVSCDVVAALVDAKVCLRTPDEIEKLLAMIHPLIYDEAEADAARDDEEEEQFDAQQTLVAKLIHLMANAASTDVHYKCLHLARKHFGKGGEQRLLYTFPALVFNSLRLIARVQKQSQQQEEQEQEMEVSAKKMFQFVHQICSAYGSHAPEVGVRLWLQGALAGNECALADICYEFVSQAWLCFEEHVSDSQQQFEAIVCIAGYLQQIECLEEDNFDTLRSKCVAHSNRLLKKAAAAQCFILCANLYLDTRFKDGRVACKCLVKACKRASQMMDGVPMMATFVQVLNKYVYAILNKCGDVDYDKVNQLVALVKDKMQSEQQLMQAQQLQPELQEAVQYFRLTAQYIDDLKHSNDSDIAEAFAPIELK
eukprot:CAMPEP_0202697238 /NCGR_PEP_ID=MMETSP1385-20130828/10561_1 /ASSEMBLY_ACC=CAM_ASM_000861 /TAXON_ID=933848 /ORGANISM="Elphidium margaritaceum" /LENGTH=813 /DNA_ID=CAMNT_0049353637 /DNA_START=21 /DNA_END=2460 /DNA_ORIENTATION=-